MAYFPFMIELNHKTCLIAGGGNVAWRKAQKMLAFGAQVTVVAPRICSQLLQLEKTQKRLTLVQRGVCREDLAQAFVVILATANPAVDREMAAFCREKNILVNVVDVKEECGFYFPAIWKDGEVVASVSTGGESPLLAAELKRRIGEAFQLPYGKISHRLGQMRMEVLAQGKGEETRRSVLREQMHQLLAQEQTKASKREGRRSMRIGTRGSRLALAQAALVQKALEAHFPGIATELVVMTTRGDREQKKALREFGTKAVFVEEFEKALTDGEIDVAVHSAKDLPMALADGLEISGVLPRASAKDVLICRTDICPESGTPFTVGTGSLRRQCQISQKYPNAQCLPLRGNIDTRLEKLKAGKYDAIVLAAAGLERLGLMQEEGLVYRTLGIAEMVPAAGQGIIAMEARSGSDIARMLREISDVRTGQQLEIERGVLEALHADCHDPVGVYACPEAEQVTVTLLQAVRAADGQLVPHQTRLQAETAQWQKCVKKVLSQQKTQAKNF